MARLSAIYNACMKCTALWLQYVCPLILQGEKLYFRAKKSLDIGLFLVILEMEHNKVFVLMNTYTLKADRKLFDNLANSLTAVCCHFTCHFYIITFPSF